MLHRLQSLHELRLVEDEVQQLLRRPLVGPVDGLEEVSSPVIIVCVSHRQYTFEHVLLVKGELDIATAFSNNVQVLAGMKNLLLVLFQEDRNHLVSESKPLRPVLVIEVVLDVFLHKLLLLANNEFLERVLQNPLENPKLQDVKVRLRALLHQKLQEFADGFVCGVGKHAVDDIQQ